MSTLSVSCFLPGFVSSRVLSYGYYNATQTTQPPVFSGPVTCCKWINTDTWSTFILIYIYNIYRLIRANTPFTAITLEESVMMHGQFIIMFDFDRMFKSQSGYHSHGELDRVLLRIASFIYHTTLIPDFDDHLTQMNYGMSLFSFSSLFISLSAPFIVASEDLESLILWLIHTMRGREACLWASRLIKSRPGMCERVRLLIDILPH